MARVFCAWEFGGDLGHIRRLIPVAARLRAMGHEVSVAFRDSAHLESARAQGFETFIAPLLRAPAMANPSPQSFPDILLNLGFDDRRGLSGALRAWDSLYRLVQPDIVVADYAPTALVAARNAGLRRVTIGTGFSAPVLADPMPALRPWIATDPAVLRALDDRLLESVIASSAPREVPRHARELFTTDADLVCTFPEIDPLGPREGVDYVGPPHDEAPGAQLRWQARDGARVFAYLKPRDARFGSIVAGLAALDAEVVVAAPGVDAATALARSTPRMRIVAEALRLDELLPAASLCLAHAGPGLVARALVAGVPMALLPMQLEQFLVARRVAAAGSAVMLSPEEPSPDFREWLAAILARDDLRVAAARLADAHRGYAFAEATTRAAQRIAAVASG
jgi:UDP:flavonoid glycosyltransferase YjiC (YdhE family)